MAGSLEKRGKNSWRLEVNAGVDANGKYIRKRKTVKARNKTEAKELLQEFSVQVRKGEYVAPTGITLNEFVPVWRKERIKEIAPNTMETYDYAFNGRILPAIGHYKLDKIKPLDIKDLVTNIEKEGLASSSIAKVYNALNNLFKFAIENDVLQNNPMDKVKRPKVTYKKGQVYGTDELNKLYHLLNEEENKQMALLVKTALLTGMRKGELLGLQWHDVDVANNIIRIRHTLTYTKETGYLLKSPKTNDSVRQVAPPKGLMKELRKHIQRKREEKNMAAEMWESGFGNLVFSTYGHNKENKMTMFGKPLHQDSPNRWWRRFIKRINKDREDKIKQIRFHDLRHTAATVLINKNENTDAISKRLGHADIRVTSSIYSHYFNEADQRLADSLDEDYI